MVKLFWGSRELNVVKHTFGPNRPQLITVICKSAAENGYITKNLSDTREKQMAQQFIGLVQFLNSAGEVVLTIDPDTGQFAVFGLPGKTVIDWGALVNDNSISSTRLRLGNEGGGPPGSFEVMNPLVIGGTVLKFDAQFAVLDIGGEHN